MPIDLLISYKQLFISSFTGLMVDGFSMLGRITCVSLLLYDNNNKLQVDRIVDSFKSRCSQELELIGSKCRLEHWQE